MNYAQQQLRFLQRFSHTKSCMTRFFLNGLTEQWLIYRINGNFQLNPVNPALTERTDKWLKLPSIFILFRK